MEIIFETFSDEEGFYIPEVIVPGFTTCGYCTTCVPQASSTNVNPSKD